MRYYLAYGSNLNKEQMAYRCRNSKPIGTAIIKDHRLIFKTFLTIEPAPGESVPVGVWEVPIEDEAKLDLYEGYPKFYEKKEVDIDVILKPKNEIKKLKAFVYIMTDCREEEMPGYHYWFTCIQGYKDFNLDTDYLIHAAAITKERVKHGKANKQ